MLEGVEWQVAQFRVQLHAVVEADGVVSDVRYRLGMVGVVALPNPLHLHKDHEIMGSQIMGQDHGVTRSWGQVPHFPRDHGVTVRSWGQVKIMQIMGSGPPFPTRPHWATWPTIARHNERTTSSLAIGLRRSPRELTCNTRMGIQCVGV